MSWRSWCPGRRLRAPEADGSGRQKIDHGNAERLSEPFQGADRDVGATLFDSCNEGFMNSQALGELSLRPLPSLALGTHIVAQEREQLAAGFAVYTFGGHEAQTLGNRGGQRTQMERIEAPILEFAAHRTAHPMPGKRAISSDPSLTCQVAGAWLCAGRLRNCAATCDSVVVTPLEVLRPAGSYRSAQNAGDFNPYCSFTAAVVAFISSTANVFDTGAQIGLRANAQCPFPSIYSLIEAASV